MRLADRIAADLRRQIEAGTPPGSLTLADLSARYAVSLMPVRQAMRALEVSGHLRRDAHGRHHPAWDATSTTRAGDPPDEGSVRAAEAGWAEALAGEILRMSLHGEGVPLREEATAERFGVGRTALRQELNRLAATGLIEHIPRRGWRVRVFDEADLAAYLDVRESLELKALELARGRVDPEVLRQMLAANTGDGPEARLDNRLHAYLVECADNPYITEFFQRHGLYYRTLFDRAAPETRRVTEMAGQHRRILEAMLGERWQEAAVALSRHIQAQKRMVGRLVRAVARQGAEPGTEATPPGSATRDR